MNNEIHNNINHTERILQKINLPECVEYAEWMKEKAELKFNALIPKIPIYNNFIYWCNLGINIGSEQNKIRPCIIVRSFSSSTLCTIIPLTTKRLNDDYWFHVDLEQIDSTALVEQLRVVSKKRILKPFRTKGNLTIISKNDWKKINSQLKTLYCLRPLKK
ncbi:MAG: type II toxin-antitoxin system PemK/MazF family toxin [Clostridia bacterium]|nr:type II toxin-antitoxin system PemK/MazF family toxin [Clostridia bacterium]